MKKKLMCLSLVILTFVVITVCNIPTEVYANERQNIEDKLQQQENDLKEHIKPFDPITDGGGAFDGIVDGVLESQKTTKGEWDADNIIYTLQKLIFTLIIKTRTKTILMYAATVVISVIFMATVGSRDVNKRRRSYLILRNATVLFFIYINIPLFLIWLNTDKSGVLNITMFNIVFGLLDFMKKYSIVISGLILYSGVVKLIISRDSLPMRLQGKYLIKFAIILVVFLNLAPLAIHFLI